MNGPDDIPQETVDAFNEEVLEVQRLLIAALQDKYPAGASPSIAFGVTALGAEMSASNGLKFESFVGLLRSRFQATEEAIEKLKQERERTDFIHTAAAANTAAGGPTGHGDEAPGVRYRLVDETMIEQAMEVAKSLEKHFHANYPPELASYLGIIMLLCEMAKRSALPLGNLVQLTQRFYYATSFPDPKAEN